MQLHKASLKRYDIILGIIKMNGEHECECLTRARVSV